MNALAQAKITLQAYLEWENAQVEKHEFHRGEVFAMVGGRRVHGRASAQRAAGAGAFGARWSFREVRRAHDPVPGRFDQ